MVWSKLDHPNVVEFMGFLFGEAGFPALVTRWLENGSALEYVIRHPDADVFTLVRIFIVFTFSILIPKEGVGNRRGS